MRYNRPFSTAAHILKTSTVFLILLLWSQAANAVDVATMLQNIATNVPSVMALITASAYVMGMFFIYKGVLGLKDFGESRTMMSSQHSLKGPLILMAVGAALLYLPTSVQVGMNTFWSDPNPYGYVQASDDQWGTLYQDCFLIVQLIGTVAFIRGLVLMTHLGGQQGQPGTFGKALTHILAGAVLINLYDFFNAVYATLGISTS